MPTSSWRQIGAVLEHVEDVALARGRPPYVLDVGCGRGRYGVLIRESWPNSDVSGIDAAPENAIWRDAYDSVVGGELPRLDETWPRGYDLVLLLDVIEHLDLADGEEALAWCRRRGPTVVSTPDGFQEQDGFGRWETHRSGYEAADLWGLGASEVRTVLPRERPPAPMGRGQLVALFPATP